MLVFLDESGFMLAPTVRRTYAPIGRTPILRRWDRYDRISAISCVTVSPGRRRRLGLHFQLLPDDTKVNGDRMVEFLRDPRRQLPRPMRIVWDRGNVRDRCKAARAFLAEHPSIRTEQFPSYTPEAKPDEGVWQYTKHGRLASFIQYAGIPIRLPQPSRLLEHLIAGDPPSTRDDQGLVEVGLFEVAHPQERTFTSP